MKHIKDGSLMRCIKKNRYLLLFLKYYCGLYGVNIDYLYNIYTVGFIRPLPSKTFILTEVGNEMKDLSISVYRSRAVFSQWGITL
jgi:hypothetical protein